MSIYYTIACNTCKQRIEMPHYTDEAVIKKAGEWALYDHFSHSITIIHDINGCDEKFDEICDEINKYEEVKIE
jgi:hypothetical protein